jgi:hypothetical protein
MGFRERNKEIVFLVFDYNVNKVLKLGFPMKNLTLPVNNVFLEIKCNILRDAEIFHCIRHNIPQLITYSEKVINPGFAGKDDRSKVKDIYFL